MLKGKVYLRDCDYNKILELAIKRNNEHSNYKIEHIREAITANMERNLNYTIKSGITRYGLEVRAEYSYKEDIPQYNDIYEVVEWELLGWIMNSASRISRGIIAVA